MEELSVKEIQEVELKILIEIDRICRKEKINYYLQYGTLIGTIRHKGFIPWDDDLDIMMPRQDYERFIKYMRQNKDSMKPLELMHYSVNKKYIYPIARISDSRYIIEYPESKEYGLGVFVDIYPLDGCGDSWDEAYRIIDSFEKEKKLVRLAGIDHFVPSPLGRFRSIVKHISFCLFQLIGPYYFLKRIDNLAQKRKYENSRIVACTVWTYVPMLKEWIKPMEAEFEGKMFVIPVGYDEILKKNYNNYMELPPENERVGHHAYKAYRKEN